MRLHTSNPGYDIDDASCPLKNNSILFHKAKIWISLVLLRMYIKQKIKAYVKTKAGYKIYKCGEHYWTVLIKRHIVTYCRLTYLWWWFLNNTVDFQQTVILWHIPWSLVSAMLRSNSIVFWRALSFFNKAFIINNLDAVGVLAIFRKSKDLAISLQFHISSINKLFWSEY
jgi:hypothetical protein